MNEDKCHLLITNQEMNNDKCHLLITDHEDE